MDLMPFSERRGLYMLRWTGYRELNPKANFHAMQ